jgi:hypothetical protein
MAFLVYRYRTEILVKEGYAGGVFRPKTGGYPWHTGIPREYMKVNSKGKILCKTKEQIPIAVEMLREHYRKKIESVKHTSNVTVMNIIDCTNSEDYRLIE